ncbi:protein FAM177A1 [Photinus pyralis]|nr:protein FAM177A1 [Photinus pyralis]
MKMDVEISNNFDNASSNDAESANIKVRIPKRILHFSDGTLEEYSDDENITPPNETTTAAIVDSNASWSSWLLYKSWSAGVMALAACDYLGEHLAYFFGITTPKYWAEIEESKRIEAENIEKQKQAEGWSEPSGGAGSVPLDEIKTNQPLSTHA